MPEKVWKAAEVFGINRDLPVNYVERKAVDPVFVENLTRDRHVVIYGSSKQGKTSLRKRCLNDEDYIVVSCLNTMSLSDLHGAILKIAGYRIEQTSSKTVGGHHRYMLEFKGKGKVPLISEVEGGTQYEKTNQHATITEKKRLEIDLSDVNDIITALIEVEFARYIVLEDFHYLPVDTQKNFSFALKAFHENSKVCFIIIGVWREKNRLIYYNGDLTDRIVSIDADSWSRNELQEAIHAGEVLLNIQFDSRFVDDIIKNCFESIHLVQEACFRACRAAGVNKTTNEQRQVGATIDARALMKEIVDEQAGRYSAFITNFVEGFQTQSSGLEMYKWIIFSVISSAQEDLERGLRRGKISQIIKSRHPRGSSLNEGNVTQALLYTSSLQVEKNVRPIILDYDQTSKVLNVVDKSFLIWLAYQDRAELLSEIGIAAVETSPEEGEERPS